jgi:4-amino-4-deoxy-L-arabinose transferase-like glycosyltransferase
MSKKVFFILLFILIGGFLVRVWPLQVSHWWDETVYLQHAEIIYSGRTNYDEFILRPPLLPIIFAFAYLFKHNVMTASIVVSLISTLGIWGIYLVGKELYGELTGIIAAAFFAVTPFFITASHWIMTDVPSVTFIAFAFYFLILASRKNHVLLYGLAGAFFSAAVLLRFTSLILLFVVPLYFFVCKIRWQKLIPVCIGGAVLMLPYLVWAQLRFGFFLMPFIRANIAVNEPEGGPLYYLIHFAEVYPAYIIVGILIYVFLFFLLLKPKFQKLRTENFYDVSVARNLKMETYRNDIVLWLWLILFLAYLSFIPHKEPRYIIPAAIPLFIIGAKGYADLLQRRNVVSYAIVLLLAILIVPACVTAISHLQGPFINRTLTSPIIASQYIVEHYPNAHIYANHDYPVFAYYTGLPVQVVPGDSSFFSVFQQEMQTPGIFVEYTDVGKYPRQEWLNNRTEFRPVYAINNIVLYEYTPCLGVCA